MLSSIFNPSSTALDIHMTVMGFETSPAKITGTAPVSEKTRLSLSIC